MSAQAREERPLCWRADRRVFGRPDVSHAWAALQGTGHPRVALLRITCDDALPMHSRRIAGQGCRSGLTLRAFPSRKSGVIHPCL